MRYLDINILDSAHAWAVKNANIIHQDISDGNMLICPTVARGEDGVLRVVWKGVLADWELSKRLTGGDDDEAGQPMRNVSIATAFRTGTVFTGFHR